VSAAEVRSGARSGAAGVAGAAVSAALGFVLTAVITHAMGAAGSGELFTAIGVATIAGAACCAGADTGLLRELPRRRGDRAAAVLVVALVPSLSLSVVVALIGLAVGRGWTALLAVPVVVAATVLLAAVRATRPIGAYLSLQSVLVPAARPLLVAALVAGGAGTAAAFAGWVLPLAVAALLALALLLLGPVRPSRRRPTAGDWRSFWSFAFPRGISAAIDAGGMWVGVIMTAALAGSAQAGVFAAVGRYALAGLLVMQGLRLAVAPQLSRLLGSGRIEAAAAVYRATSAAIIVLSWPAYVVLAVFAPGFLHLFGDDFASGASALALLCGAMMVNSGVGIAQTMLLMSGRSGRHLAATATGLALSLALGWVLIPRYGALGAAVAWSAAIVAENVLAGLAARQVIDAGVAGSRRLDASPGGPGVVGRRRFGASPGGPGVVGRGRALLWRVAVASAGAGLLASAVAVPLGRGVAGLAAALVILAAVGAGALLHPRLRAAARTLYPRPTSDSEEPAHAAA
jgi:O-antigen/teichoic acid export membrane protein